MLCLLIEDDDNKRERVLSYFTDHQPHWVFSHAKSLVSGLREARRIRPDFMILDMTLPNYDGPTDAHTNKMHAFGGSEFIRQAARMKLSGRIAVLTQFESFGDPPNVTLLADLDAQLKNKYASFYLGAVYYHASQTSWQDELVTLMNSVSKEVK